MARVLKIHRGAREKGHKKLTVGLFILFLFLIIVLILNSSLFSIRTVEIEGNQRMSKEEIMADFGLEEGVNLFRYFINHIGRKISPDPRLDSVDVYIKWPNGVKIVVEESVTIGYIYFQGTYLCLNQSGYVVDSTYSLEEDLPIIKGLSVGSFTLGETPSTNDDEKYKDIVTIGSVLQKYGLGETVLEMDVRDMQNIILYTRNLTIYCGPKEDIDMKIAVIHSVLAKDSSVSGSMHVEDLSKQIYIESNL